jgi:stage II sporulation protein D
MKKIVLFTVIIFLSFLIFTLNQEIKEPEANESVEAIKIIEPENIDEFEEYIKQVLAAEVPALFHIEALKAQAVASRTYASRRVAPNGTFDPGAIGQKFLTEQEMQERWGDKFAEYYNKISLAADSTRGEIICYNSEPIDAVFHATSAGRTEDAANVWNSEVPYLVSVESPDSVVKEIETDKAVTVLERSEAGYALKVEIDGEIYSGTEARIILGTPSANFETKKADGKTILTANGYGHGVGMSQNGANLLAKSGYNYKEIIYHYYTGVEINVR